MKDANKILATTSCLTKGREGVLFRELDNGKIWVWHQRLIRKGSLSSLCNTEVVSELVLTKVEARVKWRDLTTQGFKRDDAGVLHW